MSSLHNCYYLIEKVYWLSQGLEALIQFWQGLALAYLYFEELLLFTCY
jgi:hypothetical protein